MADMDWLLTEAPPFYHGYIRRVSPGDWERQLTEQSPQVLEAFGNIAPQRQGMGYAAGKWSHKELLGHLNDVERIFQVRMLAIAREDLTPLPGFDEDAYVIAGKFNERSMESLLLEFQAVRNAGLMLIRGFKSDDWSRVGIANGGEVSVRALAAMTLGHVEHHLQVLQERY